ncbi:MAG: M23 family metallopeptidase [Spirochaetaceae bacterium]|nr:MAG: M23 family metallopeptidase [Spirochaetaceae bacterium]
MIAVIEQQRVGRRKPANEQRGKPKILEFTFPGLRQTSPVKRTSWRTVQQIRRPKRGSKPGGHARLKTPATRTTSHPRSFPRGFPKILKNLSRADLILAAVVALCLLIPLAFRLSFLAPEQVEIELPVAEDVESAMIHYLIPEGQGEIDVGPPDQKILDVIKTTSYTVRSGDTISGIAQRFNLSMDTVISFNGIQDARSLKVGTVLTIPNSNGLKYKVRRGDYLGGIAKKYAVALNELLDWNSLETSVIVPGQELFIPRARLTEMERNRVFGRLFIYPTKGRITDRFGVRRDPFTGLRRFHNGVDMAGPVGTPVIASMSGKVAMLGFNPTYGKYIILTHPEGFQTLYGHLDSFKVQKGDSVTQGQRIADMGSSGYSTGSHLHFSIFRRGEPIDPFQYLH